MPANTLLPIPPEIQSILTILMLALTLTLIYYVMVKTSVRKKEEKFVTKTIVKCFSCDNVEEREFRKGDYIGKIVGECPKCRGTMYIYAIFSTKIEEAAGKSRS